MVGVPAIDAPAPGPSAASDAAGRGTSRILNLALIAITTATVAATLTWAYRNRIDRLRWAPVPAGALAAFEQCPDNLYNRYDEGGPLLWFAPGRKVFLDGRQDPLSCGSRAGDISGWRRGTGDYHAVVPHGTASTALTCR